MLLPLLWWLLLFRWRRRSRTRSYHAGGHGGEILALGTSSSRTGMIRRRLRSGNGRSRSGFRLCWCLARSASTHDGKILPLGTRRRSCRRSIGGGRGRRWSRGCWRRRSGSWLCCRCWSSGFCAETLTHQLQRLASFSWRFVGRGTRTGTITFSSSTTSTWIIIAHVCVDSSRFVEPITVFDQYLFDIPFLLKERRRLAKALYR